jgi:hypothetical protein
MHVLNGVIFAVADLGVIQRRISCVGADRMVNKELNRKGVTYPTAVKRANREFLGAISPRCRHHLQ